MAMGKSRSQIEPVFNAAVQESGMLAHIIANMTTSVLPMASIVQTDQRDSVGAIDRVRSQAYANWLLSQPEPSSEALDSLLKGLRDAIPNLGHHFLRSGEIGPRYRRGGRPPQLTPEQKKQIVAEIKAKRGPNSRLAVIYRQLGLKYRVKPAVIKYVWLKSDREDIASTD